MAKPLRTFPWLRIAYAAGCACAGYLLVDDFGSKYLGPRWGAAAGLLIAAPSLLAAVAPSGLTFDELIVAQSQHADESGIRGLDWGSVGIQLRHAAVRARRVSWFALAMIVGSIAAALAIILLLGRNADEDRQDEITNLTRISIDARVKASRAEEDAESTRWAAINADERLIEGQHTYEWKREVLRKGLVRRLGREPTEDEIHTELIAPPSRNAPPYEMSAEDAIGRVTSERDVADAARDAKAEELKKAKEALDDATKRLAEAMSGTRVKDVTTLIVRVTIGIILIFLVQILVGIYRYSSRMAAFYQGRADVLILAGLDRVKAVSVKELIDWFAGDKVLFDKPPKSPTERAFKLASTIAGEAVKAARDAATGGAARREGEQRPPP